ncbi:hypothetical protein, partial [Xanthomonas oryzae]|uniref:hypothetical protein n=1 Tax=Xanthomonas oryzae TaxID=347 RepID=UPI001C6685FE
MVTDGSAAACGVSAATALADVVDAGVDVDVLTTAAGVGAGTAADTGVDAGVAGVADAVDSLSA